MFIQALTPYSSRRHTLSTQRHHHNFFGAVPAYHEIPGRQRRTREARPWATSEWLGWLERYAARIEDERAEWTRFADMDGARATEMRGANPWSVLRQWVLEDLIKQVERDSDSGKRVLAKVMHVSAVV